MIKHVLLGLLVCYLPNKLFIMVLRLPIKIRVIAKLYLGETVKLSSFALLLFLVFKLLPVEPVIFMFSVLAYITVNFLKNLLKLMI